MNKITGCNQTKRRHDNCNYHHHEGVKGKMLYIFEQI